MFKSTIIAAAAICTTGLFAAPAAFAKSEEVRFHDLDLTTAAGQKKLNTRISGAARRVCDFHIRETGSNIPSASAQACYKQAMGQVRDRVATAIEKASKDTQLAYGK